jgi:hypothetical protein
LHFFDPLHSWLSLLPALRKIFLGLPFANVFKQLDSTIKGVLMKLTTRTPATNTNDALENPKESRSVHEKTDRATHGLYWTIAIVAFIALALFYSMRAQRGNAQTSAVGIPTRMLKLEIQQQTAQQPVPLAVDKGESYGST